MFQSHENKVVVKVKAKYIKNFTDIMRIAHIQNNSSVEPAHCVNIVGEVVSAPKKISNKRSWKGFSQSDIKPGDIVIMSHLVIFDFAMTEPDAPPVFKNSVWYNQQEFFSADVTHIFATIRNGEIRMQNGYVMVEEIEAPTVLVLSQATKRNINTASAIVSAIGRPLTHLQKIQVERGDRVFFNPGILQHYQIDGKPFGILTQSQILGRQIPDYKNLAALN